MSNGEYFPPYKESEIVKIDLDLSNYATKTDFKNVKHVDTISFALKTNLNNLKTKIDKFDIDKLDPVPNDLNKLSKEVQADFNTLKTKVDNIDTIKFFSKTKYHSEVGDSKLKIPDVSGLLQTSTFYSKITEIEGKITTAENKVPDISYLATKTQLTTVENKIPNISDLVNKTELTAVENKIPDVNGYVK